MAGRTTPRPARTEDQVVLVALLLTLVFLGFMASVPIWFSGFVRGLGN